MRGSGPHRTHFMENARNSPARDLPGSFGAGESAAGDMDGLRQG